MSAITLYKNPLYPNYRFSKDGKVWTHFQQSEWKPLKPLVTNKNYLRVDIKDKEGQKRKRSIHRLIAETFIPNPNNYPCVNHKDENRHNNEVTNLEWCTYSYNNTYGHRMEKAMGAFLKAAERRCVPIVAVDKYGNEIHFKSQTETAVFLKRGKTTITRHLRNGRPCNGYYLELAERKEVNA